jgi:prepilin-type N-terminal cleavage/methylation domain-containing protein
MGQGRERVAPGASPAAATGRGETGFTLLELLIVIAVLGILAAVVVFSLQGVDSSAATSACESDFATTADAVVAYHAAMGAYPAGTGTPTPTDSDPGTAPHFTSGAAPTGVNAARPGGELSVPGDTTPNRGGTGNDGPWLRGSPAGQGEYGIWVANDGSGGVQVLDASGRVPVGATQTAGDCASVVSAGAATTTTTDVATTTTTTTIAPTTTTTIAPTTTTTIAPTTTTTIAPTTTTTTTAPSRTAPAFTSVNETTFRRGAPGSFTVTASGSPVPSIGISGSLPPGVRFDRANGVISGTPRYSGSYRLRFTASNGIRPSATQMFTLTVD